MKTTRIFRNTALFTVAVICLICNTSGQSGSQSLTPGYGAATYSGTADHEFMKNWLILGPFKLETAVMPPLETKQKEFFDQDVLTQVEVQSKNALSGITIGQNKYAWKSATSEDGMVDFVKLLGPFSYSTAYALAEIKMAAPGMILVSLGSDDGLKVFLNGALVHNNWIARGLEPDNDLLKLNLKKGSNQILVKVQNIEGGWSFMMRMPGKEVLNKILVESAGNGNLENVRLVAENGADVNARDEQGLTASQNALIRGRDKIINYLKERGAETETPLPSFDTLVDNIFKSTQNGVTPGAAVLVAKNGEIIYEKGFGFADVGNRVPVTPETKFRIGSITKQFIASAILKFQEEGRISIKDSLSKFIPDFPRGNEVTIHHLLTHTSGIHSYTNRNDFLKYVTLGISPEALVDTIKSLTYDFDPGDQYAYNNSGYFLLGYIIEKISGKSLADHMNEILFKPLGMNNTGIYQTNLLLENEAYGYSYEDGRVIKAMDWDMSWAGGAGALYSTVKDLFIWNEALFNGKVLSDESLKAAFTPTILNNQQKIDYGYGWGVADFRSIKLIAHSGGLHGFVSYLERQPENQVTVTVLCNSIPPPEGINPSGNALLITEYLLWPEMTGQLSIDPDMKVPERKMKNYAGRYDYGNGAVMIVTLESGQLFAQLTGQPKFPIYASSENDFNWKVVEASVKFVESENGIVSHAVHNQNGQQFEAKKLDEEMPITVDAAIFNKYTGKYNLGNNFIITISKEGDKLFGQAHNMPRFQLLPASETEYFANEMNVRLIFKMNDAGETEKVMLRIGSNEQTANRISEGGK